MSNARIAREFIEGFAIDLDCAFCAVAPDFVNHNPEDGFEGTRDGWKSEVADFLSTFSDVEITVDDVITEGDKVALRFTMTGRHTGGLLGIQPTGKSVRFVEYRHFRLRDEEIVEAWGVADSLGLLTQLGVTEP